MDIKRIINRVVLHNDQSAFAELVQTHQSALRYSIRQWVKGDTALADDIAQDVFIKVYKKLHLYDGRAKFSTWLYRIAYTTCLNHLSKLAKDVYSPHEVLQENDESVHDANLAMCRDLHQALDELSDIQRIAIHLCLVRGFSHPEAAQILAMPVGTVKTHILRARKRLQALLSDYSLPLMEAIANE